jgi:uncharacterized protein with beta-barrel porin domain
VACQPASTLEPLSCPWNRFLGADLGGAIGLSNVGFSATTAVTPTTSIYLRYDGEIGNGTDNHAVNVGVRISW